MTQHTPACHLCQEHCDCDRCKVNRAAPMLLEALEAVVNMHDGRCGSCGCEIAPEGYCGCRPLKDAVANERLCAARAAILQATAGSVRAAKGE